LPVWVPCRAAPPVELLPGRRLRATENRDSADVSFLRTLAFYEKVGVLDSITQWQLARATRNAAAHVYETDYTTIAEHFNALNALIPALYGNSLRFVAYCRETLGITPAPGDFEREFIDLTGQVAVGSDCEGGGSR